MTMLNHDDGAKLRLIREVGFDRYFRAGTWAEYNRQFFDGLAEKYDATNVLHSFGTKRAIDREAIARLDIPERGEVLDVCCGSGDLAIEILRTHPGVRVVGVDASRAMLAVAARKAGGLMSRLELVEGDALRLPYGNGRFDGAVIGFGLRNLSSLRGGVEEMRRVVKPGGFFCNIDQGKPGGRVFSALYEAYFRRVAPLVGKLVFHRGEFNSFRYLPESNRYFPAQRELCEILRACGLEEVRNYDYWRGAVAQQVARVPVVGGGVA